MSIYTVKKWSVLLLLFFIAAGLCCYLSFVSGDKEISRVVLISIDTCRSDYLSCYGYPSNITPNIDAIADQGILFANAISPIPLTLPSHSSIMTGTIPPSHGVHYNEGYQLGDSNITLAEILKEKGFTTGAILSSFVLDSKFGMDQGFDTYNDEFEEVQDTSSDPERKAIKTSQAANSWLDKHCDDKFFLFLHYFDPHFPYEAPEPFAPESQSISDNYALMAFMDKQTVKKQILASYAAEVAYVDHCIGQVIDKLKQLKIYHSTLIIITSDHGEMLREHGESSHGFFIYQSAIKVPLILKLPWKTKAAKINDTVGLIDIAPTVCSLLKIETEAGFNGVDLQQYLSGNNAPKQRNIYCETFLPTMYDASPLFAVVSDDWKYIQSTRPELYDLRNDQEELNNLISQKKHQARLLQDKLKQILEENIQDTGGNNKLVLDKESMAKLESLGYLTGSMVESFQFDSTKKDPKDLIELHSLNSHNNVAIGNRDYKHVKLFCKKMLKEDPTYLKPYSYLGTIAFEERDYEKAVEYFSRYVDSEPGSFEIFNNLGLAYLHLNNHIDAVRSFERALQLEPDCMEVHYNLGREFFRTANIDKAIFHLRRAHEIAPEDAKVNRELDRVLSGRQKIEAELEHYHNLLHEKPDSFVAHYNLAGIYFQQGKNDLALQHCSKALKADADSAAMQLHVISMLLKLGKRQLAFTEYDRIIERSSDSIEGLNSIAWFQAASTIEGMHNPQEAVKHALKACEVSKYEKAESVDTLAVAYAATGDFQKAIDTAAKAVEVANSHGNDALADRIQKRLTLYRQGKPYVDAGLKPSKDHANIDS